ncbi:uncharacterized protein LOC143793800 [Ranitomeya variabilis]|uniref:uncharacterized protein LOC143793800 n=1 Tax=Ranitomeya variabilis TaxID=490064 RepID=UPI0040569BB9
MTERRSARTNKGARYKKYVSDGLLDILCKKEKPPVRRVEPKNRKEKKTLKYFLEQAAVLPEIGEPGTQIECIPYSIEEIEAELKKPARKFKEPRSPDPPENQNEEIDSGTAADKSSKPPPKKKAKKNH